MRLASFAMFENEGDAEEDLKQSLEFLMLGRAYKTKPKGSSSIEFDAPKMVGKSMFVENAAGYAFEIKFTGQRAGKLEFDYRMIHPFYQKP